MSRPFSLLRSSSKCAVKSQRRCFHSLKSAKRVAEGNVGRVLAAQRYAATATAHQHDRTGRQETEYLDDEEMNEYPTQRRQYASDANTVPYPKLRPKADPKPLVDHLKRLFPPLEFPDTVATQMLTHISAKEAWAGHNARLAFVGRRVLQSYLLLFLHSASQNLAQSHSQPIDPDRTFNFDQIAYRTLYTYLLGELVGSQWDLARIMLWVPAVPTVARNNSPLTRHFAGDERRISETPASLKSPGLYKVQGRAVEGIMGGIFHQFGGTVAQRVFHTRLLPHILCPGTPNGLHDAFHPAALEMQSRLGGPDGLLVPSESLQNRSSNAQSRSHTSDATLRQWAASRFKPYWDESMIQRASQ